MVLDMIQYLYPNKYKKTFSQMSKKEKMLMDHRFIAYKKLMKKIKFLIKELSFCSINI